MLLVVLAAIFTLAVLGAAPDAHAGTWKPLKPAEARAPVRELDKQGQQVRFRGHGPEFWHWRYLQERQALVHRTSTIEALQLAAIVYRVSFDTLYRKASCESVGRVYAGLNPSARNPASDAEGIGQFLLSTWHGTPFARFSRYNPLASALAMGWMHQQGRGGEWAASRSCWG